MFVPRNASVSNEKKKNANVLVSHFLGEPKINSEVCVALGQFKIYKQFWCQVSVVGWWSSETERVYLCLVQNKLVAFWKENDSWSVGQVMIAYNTKAKKHKCEKFSLNVFGWQNLIIKFKKLFSIKLKLNFKHYLFCLILNIIRI